MSEESAVSALTALLVQHNEQHANDMREIRERLATGDTRMAGLEHTLGEVLRVGADTNTEARRTNGRVTKLEEWQRMRQSALAAEENFQRGRKAQRSDDLAKVDAIQTFFADWWQTIVGFGVLIAVVAGGIWALLTWPL